MHQFAILLVDLDRASVLELAEQQLFRQRLADLLLHQARHRSGAKDFVETPGGQPLPGCFCQFEGDTFFHQLHFHFLDELVDNSQDFSAPKLIEDNGLVQAIAELGAESALKGAFAFADGVVQFRGLLKRIAESISGGFARILPACPDLVRCRDLARCLRHGRHLTAAPSDGQIRCRRQSFHGHQHSWS